MPDNISEVKQILLAQLSKNEPLNDDMLVFLENIFRSTPHDAVCPCGSGKRFSQCCKLDWIILKDAAESKDEASAKKNEVPTNSDGPKWLCRVGLNCDGEIVVEPVDTGKGVPLPKMAELMLCAYHLLQFNMVVSLVRSAKERPNGPALRSAFEQKLRH